jgi:hypothetical protein
MIIEDQLDKSVRELMEYSGKYESVFLVQNSRNSIIYRDFQIVYRRYCSLSNELMNSLNYGNYRSHEL